jgi:hypothetical protein
MGADPAGPRTSPAANSRRTSGLDPRPRAKPRAIAGRTGAVRVARPMRRISLRPRWENVMVLASLALFWAGVILKIFT